MLRLNRGARQQVSQTTAQQGRPQGTVLRLYRQIINADNWTEEFFTVVRCIQTRPPVCLVKDDHSEILEGPFYAEELQKVMKTDDVYKIETILKKRKKGRKVQYLVKWLGYPDI
jgi:hypothetical protein